MTPEQLADLAHLRRARDLIDRDLTRPRREASRIGETATVAAP